MPRVSLVEKETPRADDDAPPRPAARRPKKAKARSKAGGDDVPSYMQPTARGSGRLGGAEKELLQEQVGDLKRSNAALARELQRLRVETEEKLGAMGDNLHEAEAARRGAAERAQAAEEKAAIVEGARRDERALLEGRLDLLQREGDALRAAKAELQGKAAGLEEEVQRLRAEGRERGRKAQDAADAAARLGQEAARLETELAVERRVLQEREGQVAKAEAAALAAEQGRQEALARAKAAEGAAGPRAEAFRDREQALERELREKEAATATVRESAVREAAESNGRIAVLEGGLRQALEEAAALKAANARYAERQEILQAEVGNAESALVIESARVQSLEERAGGLHAEVELHAGRQAAGEEALARATADLQAERLAAGEARTALEVQAVELRIARQDVDTLSAALAAKEGECQDLRGGLVQLERDHTAARGDLAGEVAALTKRLEAAEAGAAAGEAALAGARDEQGRLGAALSRAEATLDERTGMCQKYAGEVDRVNADLKASRAETASALQHLAVREATAEAAQEELRGQLKAREAKLEAAAAAAADRARELEALRAELAEKVHALEARLQERSHDLETRLTAERLGRERDLALKEEEKQSLRAAAQQARERADLAKEREKGLADELAQAARGLAALQRDFDAGSRALAEAREKLAHTSGKLEAQKDKYARELATRDQAIANIVQAMQTEEQAKLGLLEELREQRTKYQLLMEEIQKRRGTYSVLKSERDTMEESLRISQANVDSAIKKMAVYKRENKILLRNYDQMLKDRVGGEVGFGGGGEEGGDGGAGLDLSGHGGGGAFGALADASL